MTEWIATEMEKYNIQYSVGQNSNVLQVSVIPSSLVVGDVEVIEIVRVHLGIFNFTVGVVTK